MSNTVQPQNVKCTLSDGKVNLEWRYNPSVFSFGVTRNTTVQYPLSGDVAFTHQNGIAQSLNIPLEYPDFSKEIEVALKTINTWVRTGTILKLSYGQHQYPFILLKGYSATITRYENGSARTGAINLDMVVVGEKSQPPKFNIPDDKKPLVKTPRELAKSVLKKP